MSELDQKIGKATKTIRHYLYSAFHRPDANIPFRGNTTIELYKGSGKLTGISATLNHETIGIIANSGSTLHFHNSKDQTAPIATVKIPSYEVIDVTQLYIALRDARVKRVGRKMIREKEQKPVDIVVFSCKGALHNAKGY